MEIKFQVRGWKKVLVIMYVGPEDDTKLRKLVEKIIIKLVFKFM